MIVSRSRRRKIQTQDQESATGLLMNLALFIMLLAFFIVLNAISSFETTKVAPVMTSLERVFSTDTIREDVGPSMQSDPLEAIHEGETADRLEALFRAQLRSPIFKTNKNEGTMTIQLDEDEFVNSVMAIGQKRLTRDNTNDPPRLYFLPTLVSILQSDQNGLTYRMDMIFHLNDNPAALQNTEPSQVRENINKGGLVVQKLENLGFPQNLMSIGLQQAAENKMTLFFKRHEPFSPVQTSAENDE